MVEVEDTFAEAFNLWAARVLITAANEKWARTVASVVTGYATSTIACDAEAGIDKFIPPSETPDGRPGVIVMFFSSKKNLDHVLLNRIGQCVLTCPTTAVFDAMEEPEMKFDTGAKMRYFGDGFQKKSELAGRTIYEIPVMEGIFKIEAEFGVRKGVAGGNFMVLAEDWEKGLAAAEAAVEAIQKIDNVILPFPGGICRSGSKVGSLKYKFMKATTNHKLCPTLKGQVEDSEIPEGVESAYEIVINGITLDAVKQAMKDGIKAAMGMPGVIKITAGNYGGNLGKHFIYLKELGL
ncbi:MAG: formylmethanofuran--tetrahydromethanopterin N-formyltransferase [Candidatus Freyarchaeota archaeon]|nr:formylmethanofuran--tetrahydromethanopterin N-formyltransferase [Candidatus Freyrarchaeum guaymaensis]